MNIEEKIKAIEQEIARTQKNKATEKHLGLLKAKLAKLREQLIKNSSKGKSVKGIKKEGDATVVLLGFPSVGKSTLLSKLTNAKTKIAHYAFTTIEPIPGMMEYEHAKIQIIDVPGIIEGASKGKGGGREVIGTVRNADLIIFVVDPNNPIKQLEKLKKEIYAVGIRIDENPPNITIEKKERGGIVIFSSYPQKLSKETIISVLNHYGIHNAYITINESLENIDRLIDAIMKNRVYIPSLVVLNKSDLLSKEEINYYVKTLNAIPISAENSIGLNELKKRIMEKLSLIKIFTKDKEGNVSPIPLYVKKGSTVEVVCQKIHSSFIKNFKYAEIWGPSAKYKGQKVGLDHILKNGDIIRIITKST